MSSRTMVNFIEKGIDFVSKSIEMSISNSGGFIKNNIGLIIIAILIVILGIVYYNKEGFSSGYSEYPGIFVNDITSKYSKALDISGVYSNIINEPVPIQLEYTSVNLPIHIGNNQMVNAPVIVHSQKTTGVRSDMPTTILVETATMFPGASVQVPEQKMVIPANIDGNNMSAMATIPSQIVQVPSQKPQIAKTKESALVAVF